MLGEFAYLPDLRNKLHKSFFLYGDESLVRATICCFTDPFKELVFVTVSYINGKYLHCHESPICSPNMIQTFLPSERKTQTFFPGVPGRDKGKPEPTAIPSTIEEEEEEKKERQTARKPPGLET